MRLRSGILAVLALALPACSHSASQTQPVAKVGPLTEEVRAAYQLPTPDDRAVYVIGAGVAGHRPWLVVAYEDEQGRPCWMTQGIFGSTERPGCRTLTSAADEAPIYLLQGSGDGRGHYIEIGAVDLSVRSVSWLSDRGLAWKARLVHPPQSKFRFYAQPYPSAADVALSSSTRSWTDAAGKDHTPTTPLPAGVRPACDAARPVLTGDADALPRGGATASSHVADIVNERHDALAAQYNAFDVQVAQRNGQVWTKTDGVVKVMAAADSYIRVFLRSGADCPVMPVDYFGVPLDFVVGEPPPPPPPKTVYPNR